MSKAHGKVRFNDVLAAYREQKKEIDAAIAGVLQRGDFINGRAVREFEEAFAGYCGAAYCVGAANGTSALHLAMTAAGVSGGDEVVTSTMTFVASAEAITHAGAKVVFADIDSRTLNLDPGAVEDAITPATRAVLFVHLHGNSAGIREVAELCRRRNLLLFEDCAQAHGAFFLNAQGRRVHVGTEGAAGAFSFFPAKNLGAFGDAGAVITNAPEIASMAQRLANHGREDKYRHLVEGYNYRLDTLHAAILKVKLANLDAQVDRRNAICARYEERLGALGLKLQAGDAGARHARHLFVVLTPERDNLQTFLKDKGIETGVHYPIPLHLQPAYAGLGMKPGSCPVAEEVAGTTLSLPLYPQLPDDQVEYVCDCVEEFFRS